MTTSLKNAAYMAKDIVSVCLTFSVITTLKLPV